MRKAITLSFTTLITVTFALLAFLLLRPGSPSPVEWLESTGTVPWAPFAYMLIYVLATGLGYPASILTIVAGPLFGLWKGFAYVLIASNLTATLCFGTARKLGAPIVSRILPTGPRSQKISALLDQRGFETVFLLRLFPIHFALFNYVSGLSSIHFRDYALGTLLGKLPGLFLYVWFSVTVSTLDFQAAVLVGLTLLAFLVLGQKVKSKLLAENNS